MKPTLWAAIGALLAAPLPALAQQSPNPADPANPANSRAAVPPPVYESAFARTSQSAPGRDTPTPDKLWRAANDTVAGASVHGGHAGHAPAPAAPAPAAPASDHGTHH